MAEGFGIPLAERPGVGGGESSDPEDSAAPGDIVTSEWREPSSDTGDDDEAAEWLEQREEEKMALESIYENTFQEKIATKVWELRLELPHLWRHLPGAKEAEQKQKQKANRTLIQPVVSIRIGLQTKSPKLARKDYPLDGSNEKSY